MQKQKLIFKYLLRPLIIGLSFYILLFFAIVGLLLYNTSHYLSYEDKVYHKDYMIEQYNFIKHNFGIIIYNNEPSLFKTILTPFRISSDTS